MRDDWQGMDTCDHILSVCWGCATDQEMAAYHAMMGDVDEVVGAAAPIPTSGGVYLLHYTRRYPHGRHPQHYLGWARNIQRRVRQHASGTSQARLPEVMRQNGIRFVVAQVWQGGDRNLERRLKHWNKGAALCPI